ncbi:MAG: hypothetical protein PUE68_12965, partial [Kiritimatiellae bacterium]|nr:hypothetical protein [Kiritimatiellia bacterium]
LAARLTGRFARAETTPLAYRLGHPHHLSGRTDYVQTARYCPAAAPVPESVWSDGPSSVEDREDLFEERCICWVGCTGCDCPCHGPGCELERPQDDPDRCPDHACPFDDCRQLHLGDYAAATNSPHMLADVLKLHRPHRPQDVSAIVVDAPDGWVQCCGCPGHWTNYVAVAYKDARVSLHLDGAPFDRTVRDCVLDVRGVAPSDAVGDAVVALCRTGEVYEVRRYTVLGVGIAHPELDLDRLNALDRDFGLPVTAQTNLARAAVLKLRTDVNLPMGRVRLEFAEATARLQLWTRGPDGTDLLLLDTEGSPSLELPVAQWRRLVSQSTVRRETEVRLLAFGEGRARLHFGYAGTTAVGDGGPACFHDSASQAITVVPPPLLPDYDRDGSIDAADAAILRSGRPYRFWTNEDVWDGDNAFDNWIVSEVVPRGNGLDGKADGRCDMVNFFPLAVDVAAFLRAWEGTVVSIRAAFGATQPLARFREVSVPRDEVANLHVADAPLVGGGVLHEAVLTPLLGAGSRLSGEFLAASAVSGAVLAVEAVEECEDPFELVVSKDGAELFTYRPPMRFTPVEAMYRWLNVRAAGGDYGYGAKYSSRLYDPANNPDDEHAGPAHFVFVHGYNVSVREAKYWGEGVFKRLWWSGLDARFTAVTWHGNDGQYWVPTKGLVTPNYHVNVEHAFATAGTLAAELNGLAGDKYILAHSLGNVLVSSSIHDHGLRYAKYFLLNAAVPLEAFSPVAVTPESRHDMTPADWRKYSDPVRASHWNELFPEGDWRRSLTWRGRFAGIANAVNYYSAEEEVLANGDGTDKELGREYAWYTQEVTKGRKTQIPMFGDAGRDEAGWSFNAGHDVVTNYYLGMTLVTDRRPLTDAEALPLTNGVLRMNPFFGHFEDRSVYQPTNGVDTVTNATMRARLLADAIPAQSYAVGRNAIPSWEEDGSSNWNIPLVAFKDDCQLEVLPNHERAWVHSFFLRVPFSATHGFFQDLINRMPRDRGVQ